MKTRILIINMLMLAMANASSTILYFAQMNRLYDYFSSNFVYLATISFAYFAQAAGLLLFMALCKFHRSLATRRSTLILPIVAFAPLFLATLWAPSGSALMALLVVANVVIGFVLAGCFTSIASNVDGKCMGICWGAAYALGNLLVWAASTVDASFLMPARAIPLVCVGVVAAIAAVMLNQALPEKEPCIESAPKPDRFNFIWVAVVIVLMTIIYTIGSADYSMIAESEATSSTFYTRCLYAAGLLLAGFIYDRSQNISAILTLASMVYPLMASILLRIEAEFALIYGISFFSLGFLAVFRSMKFISLGSENREYLYLAGCGLLLSRLAEGVTSLFSDLMMANELIGFVLSGILFVPLVIVFYLMMHERKAPEKSDEERLADFARQYGLTRREGEIISLLLNGATNGEIAQALVISEGTARFHVSNVLKKTGCKNRNDVVYLFRQ